MRYPVIGDPASITARREFEHRSCNSEELESIHNEKRKLKSEAIQDLRSGKWANACFVLMTADGDRVSFSPKD